MINKMKWNTRSLVSNKKEKKEKKNMTMVLWSVWRSRNSWIYQFLCLSISHKFNWKTFLFPVDIRDIFHLYLNGMLCLKIARMSFVSVSFTHLCVSLFPWCVCVILGIVFLSLGLTFNRQKAKSVLQSCLSRVNGYYFMVNSCPV